MFFDFSIALNTTEPFIVIDMLLKPNVSLILHGFLINRPKWVKFHTITSYGKSRIVGAAQVV